MALSNWSQWEPESPLQYLSAFKTVRNAAVRRTIYPKRAITMVRMAERTSRTLKDIAQRGATAFPSYSIGEQTRPTLREISDLALEDIACEIEHCLSEAGEAEEVIRRWRKESVHRCAGKGGSYEGWAQEKYYVARAKWHSQEPIKQYPIEVVFPDTSSESERWELEVDQQTLYMREVSMLYEFSVENAEKATGSQDHLRAATELEKAYIWLAIREALLEISRLIAQAKSQGEYHHWYAHHLYHMSRADTITAAAYRDREQHHLDALA